MEDIIHRLHRVQGQIAAIEGRITEGDSCEETIPQIMAIKGSVDSFVRAYIEHAIDGCMEDDNPEKAKKMIKVLIKNM